MRTDSMIIEEHERTIHHLRVKLRRVEAERTAWHSRFTAVTVVSDAYERHAEAVTAILLEQEAKCTVPKLFRVLNTAWCKCLPCRARRLAEKAG